MIMDAAEIKHESAGERKISAPASLFQQEIRFSFL